MILLSFEYIRRYDDTFHFFGKDSNDNGTCYNFPPDDTTWILLIIDITFYNDTNKTYLITSLTLKLMSFLFFLNSFPLNTCQRAILNTADQYLFNNINTRLSHFLNSLTYNQSRVALFSFKTRQNKKENGSIHSTASSSSSSTHAEHFIPYVEAVFSYHFQGGFLSEGVVRHDSSPLGPVFGPEHGEKSPR